MEKRNYGDRLSTEVDTIDDMSTGNVHDNIYINDVDAAG